MKTKVFAVAILAILALSPAYGQGYIIDQQSPYPGVTFAESGVFLSTNQPIGQSFTPTLPSIDFVFLQLTDYNWNNGTGAVVFVKLFSGSLTNGTLLGTTAPLFLPDGLGVTSGDYGETNFIFTSSISLTPGTKYFLQPVLQSGDPGFLLGVAFLGYTGGDSYGVPYGRDVWFREGVFTTPEPSSLALLLLGCGFLACFRKQKPAL